MINPLKKHTMIFDCYWIGKTSKAWPHWVTTHMSHFLSKNESPRLVDNTLGFETQATWISLSNHR